MQLIKRDDCLWLKHLPDELRNHLESVPSGNKTTLLINGSKTEWKRMREGRDGRSTSGFTIVSAKAPWARLAAGTTFEVEIPNGTLPSAIGPACVSPDHPELVALIQELKIRARRYKELTGRPLGITGEIAEYEAVRAMGATLCPPREAGYDALLSRDSKQVRVQIKGRALTDLKKGRMGAIKLTHSWDVVWFVSLSDALELVSIHEAVRAAVTKELGRTPSKARKRGALSIRDFHRIASKIWPA